METEQAVIHKMKPIGRENKINAYACDDCGNMTVTIDREHGVTPFLIDCTVKGCNGMARSGFYAVPQDLIPQYEWRKPTKTEYYQLPVSTRRDHVDQGGLMMYPIKPPKEIKEKVVSHPKPRRLSVRQRRERRRQNSRELIAAYNHRRFWSSAFLLNEIEIQPDGSRLVTDETLLSTTPVVTRGET